MLIDAKDQNIGNVEIHDCTGAVLKHVVSFNTESEEVEALVVVESGVGVRPAFKPTGNLDDGYDLVTVKFILPGGYATIDGRRV